jgi:hypothetical protein
VKAFISPLPSSTNIKGSGVGSPPLDMNKISNALIEVRGAIPNSPADLGAITAAQLTTLTDRITAAQNRLNALKAPAVADSFGRTTLGANYGLLVSTSTFTLANNQIGPASLGGFYRNTPTKTYDHYGEIIVAVPPGGADHPSVVINHLVDNTQNYRGFYNVANARWEIYRRFNSVGVFVASFAEAAPVGSYTLNLKQQNDHVLLTVNGSTKIDYLDTSPFKGKYVGVYFDWRTSADSAQRISSFVYGDL